MSTSDMSKAKKERWKPVWVYSLAALFCVAVNFIYAQFSHDVSSASMTWMFLYPLLGGSGFFALLAIAAPEMCTWEYYRVYFNLHNSGIAALTVGAFLKGILEIAGTASSYTRMVTIAGWSLLVVGGIVLLLYLWENGRPKNMIQRK